MKEVITNRIKESIQAKQKILQDEIMIDLIQQIAGTISNCIKSGGKIVLCGNGGSASDALHFAGEIVGRFKKERSAWPAIVLNSNEATMTAIANDYGYDEVFARQVDAFVSKGDIFIGFSTSGNSKNVYKAVLSAKKKNANTVAFLGKNGGIIGDITDKSIIIPSDDTARIQECHIMLIHIICEIVEQTLTE